MAEPNPIDVRKAIEQSSSRSTLHELAKRGIHRVKVLDEAMIHKLIGQAVERIVSTKSSLLSSDEREKLIEASRKELDRLMGENKLTQDKAELMEKDKNSLVAQVENLQEQVKMQRKLADETAQQRYEAGKSVMRQELDELREKGSRMEEEAARRIRRELEFEFQAKMANELTGVERLKTEVAQKQASMVEEMRKSDEELFKKMSELFAKSTESVTKKLNDLRLRSFAGGGGSVGGGAMAGDVEFRPSQATIDGLFAQELDSNMKNMQVESKTGGKLGGALDRLKALRGGGAPKPEENK